MEVRGEGQQVTRIVERWNRLSKGLSFDSIGKEFHCRLISES